MKKGLIAIILILAGYITFPILKAYVIEYQVRDYLKKVNVNEFLESHFEHKILGMKIHAQGENDYPRFIVKGTINHQLNIQLPETITQQIQKKVIEKNCENLEKIKQKELDIRKGIVQVVQKDQISLIMILQDKNQHELFHSEQKIADCPNFKELAL